MLVVLIIIVFGSQTHAVSDPLPRNGIGQPEGYGGTVYQAFDFVPVCGTLDNSLTQSFSITSDCDPAMSVYNGTKETFSFFDLTGVRLSATPGSGTPGCMCFSLSSLSGEDGDLCIWIDGSGAASVYWNLDLGYIDASTFHANGQKALPQCKDVNITAISLSL